MLWGCARRQIARRFWLVLGAVGLMVGLSMVLSGVTRLARGESQSVVELPTQLLPGHQLPGDVNCSWLTYHRNPTVSCYVTSGEQSIYLLYDAQKQAIVLATQSLGDNESIGDLVQVWGTPTGVQRLSWGVRVHWNNRYVYMSEPSFRPESIVHYVTYILDPQQLSPWHGFTAYER